ncbi:MULTISPECIES: primosomal replication protein PriC [Buttiauxella]|uniref:Primosomal replication protein N n=3 Tax=Buttiauxella TaxID=82976 RepID=A0ABX2W1Z1_9ENTR|nr:MULTISPECIES: primosomal replication protein PriC [Buttiauxella]AYN27300.1 prephenate dehydrogenase [Buttiauxella sp. 3AFRM03]MCE0825154.1 primosomal replication protein [Buttiauxella ferragutiae]OAT24500.1 primosomal replication protein N'' [Buttiauxella ferragutiae ATCC 51602]TDN51744.1 restart primosome assembly protein PriC [Buttiauxella sp. JUb87]UNK60398.1 primosomal replication protein [Buttiauxella ferragutiae]
MKTASLLQALDVRVADLAQAIAPISLQRASQARFDRNLFSTHSTQLKDYLSEVQANLAQLQLSVKVGKADQVAYLAEKLVAQIAALQRELATLQMRKNDPQPPVVENLYEKLSTHQDYERRLQTMISDRDSQLAIQTTLVGQQKIQKEIAALEGRLQRCRQAITRIERAIERRERGLS